MEKNQVQFEFMNEEQQKRFVKWFKKQGWGEFMRSEANGADGGTSTCLATDEKMEYGHYFEIQ